MLASFTGAERDWYYMSPTDRARHIWSVATV